MCRLPDRDQLVRRRPAAIAEVEQTEAKSLLDGLRVDRLIGQQDRLGLVPVLTERRRQLGHEAGVAVVAKRDVGGGNHNSHDLLTAPERRDRGAPGP